MERHYKPFTLVTFLLCLFWGQLCIAQTGTVLSFGDNSYGQIGDSTQINRSLPTPTFQISGVKAVACGFYHTLALDANGAVWAWGNNMYGQLGTGDTTSQSKPVLIMSNVKAIAAGGFHSLALDAGGRAWAWGYNGNGQLGSGDATTYYTPKPMAGSFNSRIKAIAAGLYHSLVLNDQGGLFGCGHNGYGQLALGDYTQRNSLNFISGGVVAMAAGSAHSLAQMFDNSVRTSGDNADGELGDGTTTTRNRLQICMYNVRSISAGYRHSLVVGQDGKAYGWGRNVEGQLGLSSVSQQVRPVVMPGAVNIKGIAGGAFHTLVQTAGGTVLATGRNNEGELGDGTTTSRATLAPVKNATFIGSIAACGYHSVMLKPYNIVYGTGFNNNGQLGVNNLLQQNKPVPTVNLNGSNYIAIATGSASGAHSLALRADGVVVAWGFNLNGQLGNGKSGYDATSAVPVAVKGPGGVGILSNIIAIAAGDDFSLALAANGSVYSWGHDNHGQLGIGGSGGETIPFPAYVPYVSNVFAIAAGGQHAMLLSDDGRIYATGYNGYGQLGFGDTQDHFFFDRQESSFDFIALAAGGAHSMALKYTGEIYAWGANYTGQLAFGDAVDRHYPTLQSGTIATAIAAAGNTSMHLNGLGEVFAAGRNSSGELGLGDTAIRFSWAYNPNLWDTVSLSPGLTHSLFLNGFGTLSATGHGALGELGLGTTPAFLTLPAVVQSPDPVIAMAGGSYNTLILTSPVVHLASIKVSPTPVKGGITATGTVTLSAAAGPGGQRVYLYFYSVDQNGNYVTGGTMPAYVDVAPGSKTATFPITTKPVTLKTTTYVDGYLNQSLLTTLTITP